MPSRRLTTTLVFGVVNCVTAPLLAAPGLTVHPTIPSQNPLSLQRPLPPQDDVSQHDPDLALANIYCSACHLVPAPELLAKASWDTTFAYMGLLLGQTNYDYLPEKPGYVRRSIEVRHRIAASLGLIPTEPAITDAEWHRLRLAYRRAAPEQPLPQVDKPEVGSELPLFRSQSPKSDRKGALTTLVRIRPTTHEIYVGDASTDMLHILGRNGKVRRSIPLPSPPVALNFFGDRLLATLIGDVMGSKIGEKPGQVLYLREQGDHRVQSRELLQGLYRTAHSAFGDLNQDGQRDLLICGFGDAKGALSWFELEHPEGPKEHVLLEEAGAVRAEIYDFDRDGLPDILALMANAREGMFLFRNRGKGQFALEVVFQSPSTYGHTYFELADFNHDGQMDFLVVNGDNLDADPYNNPKNYHGIRVYLNRGNGQFEHAYFYPMYGATSAVARDFDNDNDLDIAAVAVMPDYSKGRPEGFVYLENQSDPNWEQPRFAPYCPPETRVGRWNALDAADLEGDGDIDIVLGASYAPLGMDGYREIQQQLVQTGPALMILKNQSAGTQRPK